MSDSELAFSNPLLSGVIMTSNTSLLEGLIVLEYLNLGIMPFYPYSPKILTDDKKAKRKFRKLWRKISKRQHSYEWVRSPHKTPSGKVMWQRKILVHDWIKTRVKVQYKMR